MRYRLWGGDRATVRLWSVDGAIRWPDRSYLAYRLVVDQELVLMGSKIKHFEQNGLFTI